MGFMAAVSSIKHPNKSMPQTPAICTALLTAAADLAAATATGIQYAISRPHSSLPLPGILCLEDLFPLDLAQAFLLLY